MVATTQEHGDRNRPEVGEWGIIPIQPFEKYQQHDIQLHDWQNQDDIKQGRV